MCPLGKDDEVVVNLLDLLNLFSSILFKKPEEVFDYFYPAPLGICSYIQIDHRVRGRLPFFALHQYSYNSLHSSAPGSQPINQNFITSSASSISMIQITLIKLNNTRNQKTILSAFTHEIFNFHCKQLQYFEFYRPLMRLHPKQTNLLMESTSHKLPTLEDRLARISDRIEQVARKVITVQKKQKDSISLTRQQYYYFKQDAMELIAEVSEEIEERISPQERLASLDARLIIDSFNDQIEKLSRICSLEDQLEFAPSMVTEVVNPHESDSSSSQRESESEFEERFGADPNLILRDKAKSLAILKLAKVEHDGSAKSLSEKDLHDLIGSPLVINTDEGASPSVNYEESPDGLVEGAKKKKKAWSPFNPINTLIFKPVGKVLKLPGKLVGGVVNVVTGAVSSKEKNMPSEQKDGTHEQHVETVVECQSFGSKFDRLILKRLGKLTNSLATTLHIGGHQEVKESGGDGSKTHGEENLVEKSVDTK